MDQAENTGVGKDREGETLLIRASLFIRSIGAAGVVFGCLMSFFCYSDYLRGNETASVGLALCFLLLPGILGIFLILYGCRFVVVNGEDIVVRDIMLRRRCYRVDEIVKVTWNVDGYVFWGTISIRLYSRQHKLLFKISGFAGDAQDVHLVFALLRHLAENDVVIYGIEKTDDRVQCMLQQRFVGAEAVVRQERIPE